MIVWRHVMVISAFLLMTVALCLRVGYLGVTERDFLKEQGDLRSVRHEIIPATRGVITDRNGEPLAISTPVYAVWTDPGKSSIPAHDLERVAQIIGESRANLEARLQRYADRRFVYLKRRLAHQNARLLADAGLTNVNLQPEYRRYYPAAETTAHVVGLTDLDDRGIEGIEYAYDDHLAGRSGGKVVLKDLHGKTIRDLAYERAPVYGQDLRLSLDLGLQFMAYRELKSAILGHKARSGSVVIVDVSSGEILSLVNQPSYNPNRAVGDSADLRNRAVTDAFEPGSTVKPFSALAALESGRYQARTPIDTTPGYFHIGTKLIQDPVNHGVMSLSRGVQTSSQVVFAKLALQLDNHAVFDVLRRAGFGEVPGSGLPGEVSGYISSEELRYPVVRAAMAYGYGMSVTPLQLAQAYLTLANGGRHRQLTILHTSDERRGSRVFDRALTADVLQMMETVVDDEGTAAAAQVAGYRVAGKTGTARMVGPQGYDDQRHSAWFVGIAPVLAPRIVVVVLINEPGSGVTGGGAVAAPVFARIAQRGLPLLGVLPDDRQYALSLPGERG